nr:RHS repeat domain-containing protein [uncultured Methylobacterium sp.]
MNNLGQTLGGDPYRCWYTEERRWYHYDADGLVTAEEDAQGNVARQVWNAAGEKVAEIDAEGRRTTYRYDEHGFLAAVTDPSGAETRAYHDPDGNLEHVYDALGQARPGPTPTTTPATSSR